MSRHDGGDAGDIDERDLEVGTPSSAAAGVTAVAVSLRRSIEHMGVTRTARTLNVINQPEGFDCPGCAWPEADPAHRHRIEFCENGTKAVAEEATTERIGPVFFAQHSVDELAERTDYWLGRQGRLTRPMVRRPGATNYSPIDWDDAFALVADELRSLDSPDEAVFYTSGRTSNEAAFVYQLMVRAFGTNNLPDCSNMCHEATGVALGAAIGVGKGSVRLADFAEADVILVVGQNPGTNHPRMLSTLEEAKRGGATIIAINPLPEAGLLRFRNPQRVRGIAGAGTELSDLHLPIRLGADRALFQRWSRQLIERDAIAPGTVDRAFVEAHTHGYDELAAHLATLDPDALLAATGLERELVDEAFEHVAGAKRLIICWAMGITQHVGAVETIREMTNLALLGGHIGRPGAGLCPVRGHSNVQGDRTMGIWERPAPAFLDRLEAEFGLPMPRDDGHDVADAIGAFVDGDAKVLFCLGGNFVRAIPDTERAEAALARARLTVHVSTKLNRSHVAGGRTALILPTLGRTEVDLQATGNQFVTVEDSMGMVHRSQGVLQPADHHLRSEVAIVTGIAEALLGRDSGIDWAGFRDDYSTIRDHISRVVVGFDDFNTRVASPAGFELPHPPRDRREFPTATGAANFAVTADASAAADLTPANGLLLQTLRSHDQYNTTIYGLDDRYRGISGGRLVVMVNPTDIERLGLRDGQLVDLVSHFPDGERRVRDFRVVAYDTPPGCAAAYYPETNPLIALDHRSIEAGTPASKAVPITLEPATSPAATSQADGSVSPPAR
ncbi:MAG: FdhF/YdeP family oxidoreductase [Acidimicrobiales bacterium]